MGWYGEQLLPRIIDRTCGLEEVRPVRDAACARLTGRVLELGFGSGLNLPSCPPDVTALLAVEPSDTAWRLAARRVAAAPFPVARSGLDGARLEEPDGSVDAVLVTFTLCTVPDPSAALQEAFRVLRSGGELSFVEHGAAPTASVRRWQSLLEPVQRRLAGGCHLTRRPVDLVAAAGFEVTEVEEGYLPGPLVGRPLGYLYRGRARRP